MEMGIYYDSMIPGHWGVDKSLAMEMSINLQYTDPATKAKSTIINYDPGDKQWWITGFNPDYPGIDEGNLKATYSVTFNTETMYTDFYNKFGDTYSDFYDSRWKDWSLEKYSATLYF